jgi:hypothetical protein
MSGREPERGPEYGEALAGHGWKWARQAQTGLAGPRMDSFGADGIGERPEMCGRPGGSRGCRGGSSETSRAAAQEFALS